MLGVGLLIASSTALFTAIKLAGAAYLVYIGVRTFLARGELDRGPGVEAALTRLGALRAGVPDQRAEPEDDTVRRVDLHPGRRARTPVWQQAGYGLFMSAAHLGWFGAGRAVLLRTRSCAPDAAAQKVLNRGHRVGAGRAGRHAGVRPLSAARRTPAQPLRGRAATGTWSPSGAATSSGAARSGARPLPVVRRVSAPRTRTPSPTGTPRPAAAPCSGTPAGSGSPGSAGSPARCRRRARRAPPRWSAVYSWRPGSVVATVRTRPTRGRTARPPARGRRHPLVQHEVVVVPGARPSAPPGSRSGCRPPPRTRPSGSDPRPTGVIPRRGDPQRVPARAPAPAPRQVPVRVVRQVHHGRRVRDRLVRDPQRAAARPGCTSPRPPAGPGSPPRRPRRPGRAARPCSTARASHTRLSKPRAPPCSELRPVVPRQLVRLPVEGEAAAARSGSRTARSAPRSTAPGGAR